LFDFSNDSFSYNTILNLILGGTTFFVFISGFLFHHVFYQKFDYKQFIIKKTKYVLFPFIFLSTIPLWVLLLRIWIGGFLSSSYSLLFYKELLSFPIFRHYATGVSHSSFIGYWYIPFIIIVFAMSPLFLSFIKLRLKTQILIAFFLLICSIFMHRGTYHNWYSVFQNVFFFAPIYMFGIIFSEKKDVIYSKFSGKEFYILIVVFALAIFEVFTGAFGNYHKAPFTYGGIDLMIIQKILLCLFFMIFLNRFENYKLKLLELIAVNSFGVFFIHGIIIWVIAISKVKLDFSFTSNSFLIYCLVSILVFILSIFATLFVKRLFPKHSRFLVGS